MKTLGIIGFGNFGRFAAQHLADDFEIFVYDVHHAQKGKTEIHNPKISGKKIRFVSLAEAAAQPYVLICVPFQNFVQVLEKIKPHLKPNALILDVCSVKTKPRDAMDRMLPKTVQIIGTHPLFGPQSGKNGLEGLEVVVCPVRVEIQTIEKVKKYLEGKGLRVLKMMPEEHDDWMAKTQALAHVIGRAAKELDLPKAPFRLATYDALLSLRDLVSDDSDALFDTIQNENPAAAKQRKRLIEKIQEIENRLEGKAK